MKITILVFLDNSWYSLNIMKKRLPFRLKFIWFTCLIPFFFAVEISAQESNPIITVLDFKTGSIAESDMQLIVTMLSTELFNTGKYTVIDASQRDVILAEMAFSLSGCVDESCQLEVGKMLSADMIVVGSVGRAGSRLILDTKILRTETGETVYTANGKYVETDELIDDLPFIALKLTGDTAAGLEPVKKQMTAREITGWSLIGGGAVLGMIGGVLMATAADYKISTVDVSYQAYQDAWYGDDFETLRADYLDNLESYKLKSISGTAAAGAGIGCLAAGIVLLLLPDTADNNVSVEAGPSALSFRLSY